MDFNLMNSVLGTLAPVFLIVLLGTILRNIGFLDEAFSISLNKLVFWVALPCMLFQTISEGTFSNTVWTTAGLLMLTAVLISAAAWVLSPYLGISSFSRGAFAQCAFRSNSAYVGLPVIMAAYAGIERADSAIAFAALTLAPSVILYNALAVLVLSPQNGNGGINWKQTLLTVITNPLIIACVAGAAALTIGFKAPTGIERTLRSLGSIAGPGALMALGSSLTMERVRGSLKAAHISTVFKLIASPLLGLLLFKLANLDADATFIGMVYLACPTAVASFVMTQAMRGDSALAGSAVAISTAYSVVALGIVLALAGPV